MFFDIDTSLHSMVEKIHEKAVIENELQHTGPYLVPVINRQHIHEHRIITECFPGTRVGYQMNVVKQI